MADRAELTKVFEADGESSKSRYILNCTALDRSLPELRRGWRYFRFNLGRESLDHLKFQNRLVDGSGYRRIHRKWFPGCEFVRLRPRFLFWEAPALRWRQPVSDTTAGA